MDGRLDEKNMLELALFAIDKGKTADITGAGYFNARDWCMFVLLYIGGFAVLFAITSIGSCDQDLREWLFLLFVVGCLFLFAGLTLLIRL